MRYLSGRLIAALAVSMFLLTAPSRAQCNFIEVWVDPDQGEDVLPPPLPQGLPVEPVPVQINNPLAPTRTIQFAIDIASKHLRQHYDAETQPDQQAVIHLMPGLYAPASIGGNGEHFPIVMRDRVHLRGVGARRCVIRGVPIGHPDYTNQRSHIFVPTLRGVVAPEYDHYDQEVLVDFSLSGRFSADLSIPYPHLPPWARNPELAETMELVDGVSFQGGDVQVRFGYDPELPVPLSGRLANCLFDMRGGYAVGTGPEQSVTITGPRVGVLMTKSWTDEDAGGGLVSGDGYLDQEVHIVGNTFVLAEFVQGSGWSYGARSGSAAVVDAGWPAYGTSGTIGDPEYAQNGLYKGVGHAGLQNNVFRTWTGGQPQDQVQMATVGVSADDALVVGATNGSSNAYCRDRCGSGSFVPGALPEEQLRSIPVSSSQTGWMDFGAFFFGLPSGTIVEPLWNGSSTSPYPAPSTPAVASWDGNAGLGAQYDPAFVGEYLRTVSPAKTSYRDWRLLPGSPLKDMGYWDPDNVFAHGFGYPEDDCELLQVGLWDGESYGAPRIIDGAPDIGFDEIHLAVIAGSYANGSLSHNRRGFLNPFVSRTSRISASRSCR